MDFVMNKKMVKIVPLIIILCLSFLVIFILFWKNNINIREYTKDNKEYLTKTSDFLINNIDDDIEIYRSIMEIPKEGRKLFIDLPVSSIAVWKESELSVDMVKIFLNKSPEDDGYYESGIYYSPTNEIIDYDGYIINTCDESYEYEGGRIKYKTTKICDNWFYFEQAVW